MDLRLELVLLPVSDIDRAKAFYVEKVGFGLDVDASRDDHFRVVQLTPPGSPCSISMVRSDRIPLFEVGVTLPEPGSIRGLHLVVSDIEAARGRLVDRGVDVSEIRHLVGDEWMPGPEPSRSDYGSYAYFSDPDGNTWVLQEVPSRSASET